ncbi:hypothetical protein STA3757_30470 [Stanieria sp. NIES-3757]|nr:hypothetical protein STA3757_30470 [Stanieria sp. NIES-3757]
MKTPILTHVLIDPIDWSHNHLCLFCHRDASYWLHRLYKSGVGYCDPICDLCKDGWIEIKQTLGDSL